MWVDNATPRPLYPRGRDLAPIVQEAGWAPGPIWTGTENLAPTGFVPQTVQSTHGTIRRIFMDAEMQKANHNRSTGDQITAVYSLLRWQQTQAGNHWSRYVLPDDQGYAYSVRLRKVRLQKLESRKRLRSSCLQDFPSEVNRFLEKIRLRCVWQHVTVKQLAAASQRNSGTASCGTPELNMEAVWILVLCSHTTSSNRQRKRITLNHSFNYINWITNLTKLKTLIKSDYTTHAQSSIVSNWRSSRIEFNKSRRNRSCIIIKMCSCACVCMYVHKLWLCYPSRLVNISVR
jgi:hypothetical protein